MLGKNLELLNVMKLKATQMMSWLNEVTFKDGLIPMVNDSAFGIAPETSSLLEYGKFKNNSQKIQPQLLDIANLHMTLMNYLLMLRSRSFISTWTCTCRYP